MRWPINGRKLRPIDAHSIASTVYVAYLPEDVKALELRRFFSASGTVVSVEIMREARSIGGIITRSAFVQFDSPVCNVV
eukprot:GABW01005015.1.p1 GENE.GABW01005015.1~~GABW01005015.1.p1  ORF type:complete len:79 (-),score=1.76 GABW01005015.1:182-418(-)